MFTPVLYMFRCFNFTILRITKVLLFQLSHGTRNNFTVRQINKPKPLIYVVNSQAVQQLNFLMFKRRNMTKLISNPNHSRHRSHSEVLSKVLILYNNISLHPTWHYFKIPHSFIGAQEPFLISDFFIKNCIKTVWIYNVILISYLDKHVFPIWLSPVNFSLRKYRTWLF